MKTWSRRKRSLGFPTKTTSFVPFLARSLGQGVDLGQVEAPPDRDVEGAAGPR